MLDALPTILIAAASDASHAAAEEASGGVGVPSLMDWPLMLLVRVGVGVLVFGILICLWRMIKGPHLADRVLAGDTMAMLVAGLVVVLTIKYANALFFDAALAVAILGFVSTVAFAQYIGAKKKFADDPDPESADGAGEGGAA